MIKTIAGLLIAASVAFTAVPAMAMGEDHMEMMKHHHRHHHKHHEMHHEMHKNF